MYRIFYVNYENCSSCNGEMIPIDYEGIKVCNKCGLIAAYNDNLHIHLCKVCDNRSDFSYTEIPYACKLLIQELMSMSISPRLLTN